MAYVIAEPCIGTKDNSCVEVCPVNCIHDGGEMFYIDPAECIDCGACVSTCPVEAIFPEADVPEQWKSWIEKNALESRTLPVINKQKDPLPTAPPKKK